MPGWKDLAVDNVERMVRRDWNHPSIIIWGVRINESGDDHDFYTRTNKLAHTARLTLDQQAVFVPYDSEFLEDVFTMNDFQIPLRSAKTSVVPEHRIHRTHVTRRKRNDNIERITEHAMRPRAGHNQPGLR
jgi:beta-galactosidase